MRKFLIVGLGNPGEQYEETRHNIGFKVLDALASASNSVFKEDRHGWKTEVKHKGRTFILIKPNTYMNLSGKAVNFWLQKEKLNQQQLLVITDDIALDFGTIRLKGKGSDGGHNGLKDIIAVLGNTSFPRLRFGVGNNYSRGKQADYVLGEWGEEERQTLKERIDFAAQAAINFGLMGLAETMNRFNNK